MVQGIEMSDEEKLEMYMKLKKEELAKMLIESNKMLKNVLKQHPLTLVYDPPLAEDKVPYSEICPCNPKNGGNGICVCVMGNQMVDRFPPTQE